MKLEHQKNIQMLNTLRIPSVANAYVNCRSLLEIRQAIAWACDHDKKVYVLGGGSNVIPLQHIQGLVLQPKLKGIEVFVHNNDEVLVKAGAGENWHSIVCYCVERGYHGVENLALIPGDMGAAPIQNIGAYGAELKDVFWQLEALNIQTQQLEVFDFADCDFGYRDSVFKNAKRDQYIITSVTLKLSTKAKPNLSYPALASHLRERGIDNVDAKDIMNAVIHIRRSKLPDPRLVPNAGSFFKNPVVTVQQYQTLLASFPDIPAYEVSLTQKKLAAAWLIEQTGWKGKPLDKVLVHKDHALVLTNPSCEIADKVLGLADAIARDVRAKFDISLELEPRLIGEL